MADRNATGQITVKMQATITNTLSNGVQASAQVGGADAFVQRFVTSGVSEDQFNRAWSSEGRTLSSSASETIDIYDAGTLDIGAGAGLDALGQAVAHEEIVAILIKQTGGTGALEIIPAVSNGWGPIGSHTVANGGALKAGGMLLKVQTDTNAFDVTDASSHRITFTANGGAVTYSIYLFARHDDDESSSSSSSSSSSTSSLSSSSSSSTSSQSSSSSSSTSSLSSSSTSTLSSSSSSS